MKLNIPSLNAEEANIQTIDVGQVAIGPITVGNLTLSNANLSMSAGRGMLTDVSVSISIKIEVEWSVHIGLPWPLDDIDIGDRYDLGSISFGPVEVGNVEIPGLNDIRLHIPSLNANRISAATSNPITLELKNTSAHNINGTNLTLPTQGFSITGLGLNSAQVNGIDVPAAKMDQATIEHIKGDPVNIPSFSLGGLNVGHAQIPSINSSVPLDIPAILDTRSPGFDAGLLRLFIHLTPSANMHINRLEITDATATASVENIVINNVTLPYDVLNLRLSDIGINTIKIPSINVA